MWLWFQLRRVPVLIMTSVGVAVVCWLAGHIEVSFPSMVGEAGVEAPLKLFLPLFVVVCLGYCLDGASAAEARSVRPIRLLDIALLVVPVTVIALAAALGVDMGGLLRNCLGLVGAMLVAASVVPVRFAGLVAVTWLLAAALAGRSGESFHAWAWPVLVEDRSGWWWAASLLAVGVGAYAMTGGQKTLYDRS